MKIYYDEGMPVMRFGREVELKMGEPKEVPDHLAKELLRKGRVKVWEEEKGINHETHETHEKKRK